MVESSIASLIEKGDVLNNVEGNTYEEIYRNVCKQIKTPAGVSSEDLCNELIQREQVLSTAVGQGIAIPHPRRPLFEEADSQRIIVCFLRNPIDMQAPDAKRISVMFILLSNSTKTHIQTLSELARLLRNKQFQQTLASRPSRQNLISAIRATN